jgi:hypothetical protein
MPQQSRSPPSIRRARHPRKRRNLAECGSSASLRLASSVLSSAGRALQILGLVLLPMGLIYGFEGGPNAMSLELGFLAAGAAAFLIGLKLQRRRGG